MLLYGPVDKHEQLLGFAQLPKILFPFALCCILLLKALLHRNLEGIVPAQRCQYVVLSVPSS